MASSGSGWRGHEGERFRIKSRYLEFIVSSIPSHKTLYLLSVGLDGFTCRKSNYLLMYQWWIEEKQLDVKIVFLVPSATQFENALILDFLFPKFHNGLRYGIFTLKELGEDIKQGTREEALFDIFEKVQFFKRMGPPGKAELNKLTNKRNLQPVDSQEFVDTEDAGEWEEVTDSQNTEDEEEEEEEEDDEDIESMYI